MAQLFSLGDHTGNNDHKKYMWVKKSPEQQKRESQKSRILSSIGLAAIIFLGCVFTNGGGIGYALRGTYFKHELHEIIDSIPFALLSGLIVGLIGYWLLQRKNENQLVMICQKCEKTKFGDGNLSCLCGGHFEDIKNMKWIENQKA